MKKWNENLEGKEWKKLRNIKNKFLRSYDISFIPSKEIEKKKFKLRDMKSGKETMLSEKQIIQKLSK